MSVLREISTRVPLVFAVHPRTQARLAEHNLAAGLSSAGILATPPLPYLQTIGLMREARFVITDSGGVQEETTALGVPCLTARDTTERPVTISEGTNTLIGLSTEALKRAVDEVLERGKRGRIPDLWGRGAPPSASPNASKPTSPEKRGGTDADNLF